MQRINVDDIPEQGLQIDCYASQQPWLRAALQRVLSEHFLPDDEAHLQLTVFRTGSNVDLLGGIHVRSHLTCDRCLREFPQRQEIPVHMLLTPLPNCGDWDRREGADADDLGFGVYEGRQIDLDPIIGEHVLLAQPMQALCSADCHGLCPNCGWDLNNGPCECSAHASHQAARA